jgi:hypothetical protein
VDRVIKVGDRKKREPFLVDKEGFLEKIITF